MAIFFVFVLDLFMVDLKKKTFFFLSLAALRYFFVPGASQKWLKLQRHLGPITFKPWDICTMLSAKCTFFSVHLLVHNGQREHRQSLRRTTKQFKYSRVIYSSSTRVRQCLSSAALGSSGSNDCPRSHSEHHPICLCEHNMKEFQATPPYRQLQFSE